MPLEFFIDEGIRRTPLTEEEKAKKEEKALRRMLRHLQVQIDMEERIRQKNNHK
jgi:hypothetical protein